MGVPGNANALLLRSAAAAGGYQVSRSLRFNSADSAYLSRTPGSAGNQKIYTLSMWIKRSKLGQKYFFGSYFSNLNRYQYLGFNSSDQLEFFGGVYTTGGSTSTNVNLSTLAVYRDVSAWYHLVLAVDTTQATNTNRVKLYVNGTQVTDFGTATYPAQNSESYINSVQAHYLGDWGGGGSIHLDGYLADIYLLDGTATTPSTFAETDAITGQWVPKTPTSISYGTNGFKLTFADNSAATATTLGKDSAGSNNWTPNNFQATVQTGRLYAQASGTSTSAFSSATLLGNFPATVGGSYAIYDADLLTATTSATFSYLYSFSSVVEVLVSADGTNWTSKGNQSSSYTTVSHTSAFRYVRWFYSTFNFGITNNPAQNDPLVDTPTSYGTDDLLGGSVRGNYCVWNPLDSESGCTFANGNLEVSTNGGRVAVASFGVPTSGKWYWEGTFLGAGGTDGWIGAIPATNRGDGSGRYYRTNGQQLIGGSWTAYGASYGQNDIIGVALDQDNNTVTFYKNGTSQGAQTSIPLRDRLAACNNDGSAGWAFNFGQRAWAYTPPANHRPLVNTLLPAPVIAKSSDYFQTVLYTGNGSTQTISGLGFSPDFVWIKDRSQGNGHGLFDVIRGVTKGLFSNLTNAEITDSNSLTSFDSTGFSTGSGGTTFSTNINGNSYVAWAWDAGTSTVTNTQGSITSSVRANTSSGFSIVTFNSGPNNGVNQTIGHGCGGVPQLIIVKSRTGNATWTVYHASATSINQFLALDATNAVGTAANIWGAAAPTSTVFGFRSSQNQPQNTDCVAYVWAPVAGYSSFGSYTGNGSADGPFVYTGMRPRFLIYKRTDAADTFGWIMIDSSRDSYNVATKYIGANTSAAEAVTNVVDFLSNGFKLRLPGADGNVSGGTYVYAAFAENPFQYARAR